jgi:hypothetical protein
LDLRSLGFFEVVQKARDDPYPHTDLYHILHNKLTITGKRFDQWSKSLFSNVNIQLHMTFLVITTFTCAVFFSWS